ncbi:MAG: NADP-dependent oxidoreductase [Nocardioides sp.]
MTTTTARRVVAAAFGGPEVLEMQEVELAEPGPGQVLVSLRAAGVNPIDARLYGGPGDPAHLPIVLGYEGAGVVTAVGEGAADDQGPLSVGDEVIAFRASAAYATDLLADAGSLTRKPATLGWTEAAVLMLSGATAVHALSATAVGEGDTVLVNGAAGGVGLYAVQLARLRGAARVIATASEDSHGLLRDLGAEPVVYGDGLLERVRALAPQGVDAALDLVGSDEALDVSLALVPDRSRVTTIAHFVRGPQEGVMLPGGPESEEIRDAARPELARLAGEGRLKILVAQTYPLAEAAAAHRQIATGHTTGKLALLP